MEAWKIQMIICIMSMAGLLWIRRIRNKEIKKIKLMKIRKMNT